MGKKKQSPMMKETFWIDKIVLKYLIILSDRIRFIMLYIGGNNER